MDLDGFKAINDSLGHAVGDGLLVAVAQRIRACIRGEDMVARIGGDEFVVVMSNLSSPEVVEQLSENILSALRQDFQIEDATLRVTSSIGIAVYPNSGESVDALMKNADAAMYEAKQSGRNTYRFFEPAMHASAMRHLQVRQALQQAIDGRQFRLHFQPKYRGGGKELTGLEALLRWHHPELGEMAPSEFIPIAERSGQILCIGDWVLQAVCEQIACWDAAGMKPVKVALNLSPLQMRSDLVDSIIKVVSAAGIAPQRLMFEITETAAMKDVERTTRVVRELQSLGFDIAIDDFGTGYSSLAYLAQFHCRQVKIDRFFTSRLDLDDHSGRAIVAAIIALAHALQMEVVAEGVETEGQLRELQLLHCDQVQGFLLGRPDAAPSVPGLDYAQVGQQAHGHHAQAEAVGQPEAGRATQGGRGHAQRVESQQIAAAQSHAPQCDRVDDGGHDRHLVGAQHEGGSHLHGIEELVEGDVEEQRQRRAHDDRVGRVGANDVLAQEPHDYPDHHRQRHGQADAGAADLLGLGHVAAADGLCHQGAGGAGDGQRQHVEHRADVGRDLVAGHRNRTQAGNEDRHQGEGGDLDEIGHADRNAQPQQRALAGPGGRHEAAAEELERTIQRQARHQQPGRDHHQPGDHRGGDGAAGAAEGGHAQAAEDEQRIQGQLEQQATQLQGHHHLGFGQGRVERRVDAEEQCGRQRQGLDAQVQRGFFDQFRRGLGDGQEERREHQDQRAHDGQQHRQPHALLDLVADLAHAAGAIELADSGLQGLQHAGQTDQHAHVDRYPQRQRTQVQRGKARDHGGIDDAIGDDGQLADQQRPGQPRDAAGVMAGGEGGQFSGHARSHPGSAAGTAIETEALVTVGGTAAFPDHAPVAGVLAQQERGVLVADVILQQQVIAALIALIGKAHVPEISEGSALGRPHIGLHALLDRGQPGFDLLGHARIALAIVDPGQPQRHQQHPAQDHAARRQHHRAPQHRGTARDAPVHHHDPGDGGGHRDGQRDPFEAGLEARRELVGIARDLGRPAGFLGDPADPDEGRRSGQRHYREPVHRIDGAAFHGGQAEGGQDRQRRQQRQQHAFFAMHVD
ncbi:hypothetical protein Lal_00007049 [Lupinus albus]|nr:hypothetical protein Lal_00007049 [Lupinus albus]